MLQRHRRVRQVNNRHTLHAQGRRAKSRAIASLNGCLVRSETPLWFLLVARGNLHVRQNDGSEIYSLDAIRDEVHAGAVIRLIGIARRVNKEPGLRLVVPFGMAAGDALLIALIENDVAVSDNQVRGVIDGDFVSLHPKSTDAS